MLWRKGAKTGMKQARLPESRKSIQRRRIEEEEIAKVHAVKRKASESQVALLQHQIGNRAVQDALIQHKHADLGSLNLVARKPRPRTQEEARALVPVHVEPKACFIWYVNSLEGWGPMPGTGCAHWVAHQLGLTAGLTCNDGFSVRVRDVIVGKEQHPLKEAQVGDMWVNPVDASHVGIVRAVDVDPKSGQVTRVQVEHDSSRQGAVVKNWFTSGDFYR